MPAKKYIQDREYIKLQRRRRVSNVIERVREKSRRGKKRSRKKATRMRKEKVVVVVVREKERKEGGGRIRKPDFN